MDLFYFFDSANGSIIYKVFLHTLQKNAREIFHIMRTTEKTFSYHVY